MNNRLFQTYDAAYCAGFRDGAKEPERQRDEHRKVLNKIADMLGVVHEDDKIIAAVKKLKDGA